MRAWWLVLLLLAPSAMAAVSPQQVLDAPSGQAYGSFIDARTGHALVGADPTIAPLLGESPNGPGGMWFYGDDGTRWNRLLDRELRSCQSLLGTQLVRSWALGEERLVEAAPCEDGAPPDGLDETVVNIVDPINQGRTHHWQLRPLDPQPDVTMPSDGADRLYFGVSSAAGDGWWATTWETSELLRVAGGVDGVTDEEVSYTHVGIFTTGAEPVWQQTAGPFEEGTTPPHFEVDGIDQDIRVTAPDGQRWALDASDMQETAWTPLPPGSGKHGITARLEGQDVQVTERTGNGWQDTARFSVDHELSLTGAIDADRDLIAVGLRGTGHISDCDPGPLESCPGVVDEPGHVLIYRRDQDGTWNLHEDVIGPTVYGDQFGFEVGVTGHQVLIGAPGTDASRDMWGRTYIRTVNQWPTAAFHWDPAPPLSLSTITFTSTSIDPEGQRLSHAWDFDGDGETDATGTEATWRYERPGLHDVTLTVTDTQEGSDVLTQQVVVTNRAPVTDFYPVPTPIWRLRETTIEQLSWDPDGVTGQPATCEWDLDGDGAFERSGCEDKTMTWQHKGTYDLTLRACDDGDLQGDQVLCVTRTRTFEVFNHHPVIEFTLIGDPITLEPFQVRVDVHDPDGTITSEGWRHDADGRTIEVTRSLPGTLRLGYEATDDEGDTTIAWFDVAVANRDPTAAFELPEETATRTPLRFTDQSSDPDGRVSQWHWDFGDGNTSSDRHPLHTYQSLGTYTVSLTVADGHGGPGETVTQALDVDNEAPRARIDAAVDGGMLNLTDLSTDPDGTIVSRSWSIAGTWHTDAATWRWPLPSLPTRITLNVTDDRGVNATTSIVVGDVDDPVQHVDESTTPTQTPEQEAPPETTTSTTTTDDMVGDGPAPVIRGTVPWLLIGLLLAAAAIASLITRHGLRRGD